MYIDFHRSIVINIRSVPNCWWRGSRVMESLMRASLNLVVSRNFWGEILGSEKKKRVWLAKKKTRNCFVSRRQLKVQLGAPSNAVRRMRMNKDASWNCNTQFSFLVFCFDVIKLFLLLIVGTKIGFEICPLKEQLVSIWISPIHNKYYISFTF